MPGSAQMALPRRAFQSAAALAAIAALGFTSTLFAQRAPARSAVPPQLGDRDFWQLTTMLSEPGGSFGAENLVSNEVGYLHVFPELANRSHGGAYIGVGPEQNFTYIANLRPEVAFVIDLRRENRDLHLLYRALFELAHDRAEFVSLLFSLPRPRGLTTASTVGTIFSVFEGAKKSEPAHRANLERVMAWLRTSKQWPLSGEEERGIEEIYGKFFHFGPGISYASTLGGGPIDMYRLLRKPPGAYEMLMQARDRRGELRSFLSTEERFQIVRALQLKNLVVPVVGDFAGSKALRGIGEWLRGRGLTVSTFYLSNVQDYLRQNGTWDAFCRNVASLPQDAGSQFISSSTATVPPRPQVGTSWTGTLDALTRPCRFAISGIDRSI